MTRGDVGHVTGDDLELTVVRPAPTVRPDWPPPDRAAAISDESPTMLRPAPPMMPPPTSAAPGMLRPQRGVDRIEVGDGALPVEIVRELAEVFFVSAHGGAGGTKLAKVYGDRAVDLHAWPTYGANRHFGKANAVLVARTTYDGLRALQVALRQWASGQIGPDTELLGVVLVPDAPNRGLFRPDLPKPLRELRDLVVAGAPQWWSVPYIESWRTGELTA